MQDVTCLWLREGEDEAVHQRSLFIFIFNIITVQYCTGGLDMEISPEVEFVAVLMSNLPRQHYDHHKWMRLGVRLWTMMLFLSALVECLHPLFTSVGA